MLDKFTRELLKVDGEADDGEEMSDSEEAPLEMDDAIEIIDPEGLLLSEGEEDAYGMSDDEAGENGLEGENEDAVQVPYVPDRDDAKFTFKEHKGLNYISTYTNKLHNLVRA